MKFLILGLIVICFTVFFMPQANAQSHDGYSWDDYACIDSMLEFDKQALLSLQQQLTRMDFFSSRLRMTLRLACTG